MNILEHNLSDLARHGIHAAAAAAGVFDGIHRGHLAVIRAMLQMAHSTGATPCVITFSPHPRSVLAGAEAPAMLLPPEIKYRTLYDCGVQAIVEIPFTREFAALSPQDFLEQLTNSGSVRLAALAVGSNWHFGARAAGTAADIQALANRKGFLFTPVPERKVEGEIVSSTRIRQAIQEGRAGDARKMLGRRPALYGNIVHGLGFAAGAFGCPTANAELLPGVLPAFGVYAVYAVINGQIYPAVANIGLAPTVLKDAPAVPKFEIHLLGFHGNLYGSAVKAELVRFLRPEKKFGSIDELKSQILRDKENAMKVFGL